FNSATSINIGGAVLVENAGAGALTLLFGASGSAVTTKGLTWKSGNGGSAVSLDGAITVNGNLAGTSLDGFDTLIVANGLTVTGTAIINNGTGGSDVSFNGATKVTGVL